MRLPEGATNAQTFWQMLIGGVDAIREVPQDRRGHRFYYDHEPGKPGTTYSNWAGLIDEIDTFALGFFGITQREAPFVDPQQRLLFEATWEALMDAASRWTSSKSENTGVFVGISTHDYGDIRQNSAGRGQAYPHSSFKHRIPATRRDLKPEPRGALAQARPPRGYDGRPVAFKAQNSV